MKKILVPAVLLIIAIGFVYVIFPQTTESKQQRAAYANARFIIRNLSSPDFIARYAHPEVLRLEGPIANEFQILNGQSTPVGRLQVLAKFPDSAQLVWLLRSTAKDNLPWTRWNNQRSATVFSDSLREQIERIITVLEEREKQIRQSIRLIKQPDTLFISTKYQTIDYPSRESLYNHEALLQQYATKHKANVLKPLIYHTSFIDGRYSTMIALAIDRELPERDSFSMKRMIPANILEMEITGGEYSTRLGFSDLENYVQDRGYNSPALPFIQPVTNRMHEPDTAKWITRIYYPVY